MMRVRHWAAALASVAVLACRKNETAPADTSAAIAQPTAAVATTGGSCPRTGHWGDCQLRARLEASGLAPQPTTEKVGDVPTLSVAPVLLSIGKSGLAAYFFPDTLSRRKAAATLDTLKFIPQSKAIGVHSEGTVIENDNALVLLFSKNEHQRERVADAVTAGPPQP